MTDCVVLMVALSVTEPPSATSVGVTTRSTVGAELTSNTGDRA